MKFLTNLKINIQRWNYRRKYKSGEKVDLEQQVKAIQKADALSKKRKCRLWVLRIRPGKFQVCTKGDLKATLKVYGLRYRYNIYEIGDPIVHITK